MMRMCRSVPAPDNYTGTVGHLYKCMEQIYCNFFRTGFLQFRSNIRFFQNLTPVRPGCSFCLSSLSAASSASHGSSEDETSSHILTDITQ